MSTGLVLKLGMAVPNHAHKWVRVRSINNTTKNPTTTSHHVHGTPKTHSSSSSALSINTPTNAKNPRGERVTVSSSSASSSSTAVYRDGSIGWRRIAPCPPPAHHTARPPGPIGLFFSLLPASSSRHSQNTNSNKCPCFSLSSSSSSENCGGLTASSPSSSECVMASENKDLKGKEANQDHHQRQSSKFLTLPTVLTLGRVAAVPLLISTFYVDSWWGTTATTSIFIAAAITDWLDGYIARKMRLGSAFGAFLDPVADKLMVAATLVLLCSRPLDVGLFGQVPWLLTAPAIAIIGREITMSAVREWAASQNTKLLEAVAVNNLGKWKTATQMTALTILLATRDSSLGGPGFLVGSGVVLLYISAGLAVWSLAVYMSKIWRVLLK